MLYRLRRALAALLILVMLTSAGQLAVFADSKTGSGMAEWALQAYNEGWKYVFGGSEVGSVDCSGLIRSYIKGGGGAYALLCASDSSGDISTMPNVHGLGLWCEGHCGVYVGRADDGTNMAVDARNSRVNVVYSTMDSRSWNPWVKWFKVSGVTYPDTGWETYNGKQYYYRNGEYVTGVVTVDGITYDFGKSGALIGRANPTTATTTTTTAKRTTTTTVKRTNATTKTTTAAKTTASIVTTTTTAAPSALKPGMRGDEVVRLQKRLIELGYMDAKATGYFGYQTEAALKAFQRAVSITPDGIAGAETRSLLYASSAPKVTASTATTATTTTTAPPVTTATKAPTATPATTVAGSSVSQTTSVTVATAIPVTPATTTTLSPIEALLSMNAEEYNSLYVELEFGTSGIAVSNLQRRLTELGYYDSAVDGYFGVFLRIAVTSFQFNCGITETGVADAETQALLYSKYAPASNASLDLYGQYDDEDYQLDEGDYYVEETQSAFPLSLEPSSGLSAYSTQADVASFTRRFGASGALQTLGVASIAEPVVLIVCDGDSFELTEEIQQTIDDCVFF